MFVDFAKRNFSPEHEAEPNAQVALGWLVIVSVIALRIAGD